MKTNGALVIGRTDILDFHFITFYYVLTFYMYKQPLVRVTSV